MSKRVARDRALLESFEAEFAERLAEETQREGKSPYLEFVNLIAAGVTDFYTEEVRARDDAARRLFALRGKILTLWDRLGISNEDGNPLLPAERPYVRKPSIEIEPPR